MIFRIKVFPNSKTQEVVKNTDTDFEVRIKEKPVAGKANKAVISALADHFNITTSQIRVVKGTKNRNKIIEIETL